MGLLLMRYFTATADLFNVMRTAVMAFLGQPNEHASEPWPADITALALCPHEYEPPAYAAMIEQAIANGAVEITAEQYQATLPQSEQ